MQHIQTGIDCQMIGKYSHLDEEMGAVFDLGLKVRHAFVDWYCGFDVERVVH